VDASWRVPSRKGPFTPRSHNVTLSRVDRNFLLTSLIVAQCIHGSSILQTIGNKKRPPLSKIRYADRTVTGKKQKNKEEAARILEERHVARIPSTD